MRWTQACCCADVPHQDIHAFITNLHYENCKANITQVDCQSIFDNNGVLIQVVGLLTYSNKPTRKFAQTFLLRRQLV